MGKHWMEVKDEIEREIDKIWYDEPIEVTLSKKGIYPEWSRFTGKVHGESVFSGRRFHVLDGLLLSLLFIRQSRMKILLYKH